MEEPVGFAAFVASRSRSLLRAAWLLTGDWASAEDLVQVTLVKILNHWETVSSADAPDAYVRTVLVRTYLGWRRRRWTGEVPTRDLPERSDPRDVFGESDLHHALLTAVRTLPPRQRAAVMLRYFEDLSEADTAAALGCSIGTVKSQCSRALRNLRSLPGLGNVEDADLEVL